MGNQALCFSCYPRPVVNPSLAILRANEDKLWERVEVVQGCYLWLSTLDKDGYGIFQFRHEGVKYQKPAHIAAYVITTGEEPKKLLRHTCHHRPCCRPKHLIPGTHTQNMRDMVHAGRAASGSANARSKLVERDIPEIDRLLRLGVSKQVIADAFGVDRSTIDGIGRRELWKQVPR